MESIQVSNIRYLIFIKRLKMKVVEIFSSKMSILRIMMMLSQLNLKEIIHSIPTAHKILQLETQSSNMEWE